jgi:hypothetical protein
MSSDFSYFDQFSDMEVNLNPYLNDIKSSGIDYAFTNLQPVKVKLKNLFERVEVASDFKKNILNFTSYQIIENERPEDVAYKIYGSVDDWWVICIFNDIKNIYLDWPMSEEQLQDMADVFYSQEGIYKRDVYYDLLSERNEGLRNILILNPFYLNDLISAFRTAMGK